RVSVICLGAMTFGMPGWGCDEATSLALVERFLEAGGNFIDTADAYAGTISEEICGRAMAGRRTQFVLATKATLPVGSGPNDRGASRKHLRESCDASLRRLRTDYIDLYQIHAEDLWTPIEETLAALDDLVRAGKVLYVGASNYRAYRLMKALALSDRHGWARFVSLQPQYNLLVRTIEREQLALAWQLAKPEVTSVIIGARNVKQLEENLGATEVTVPDAVMARLEEATAITLEYPGVFIDFIQRWLGNC